MKVKRPACLTCSLGSGQALDITSLLRGESALQARDRIACYHITDQKEYLLSRDELMALASASSLEWRDARQLADDTGVPLSLMTDLARRGLLLSDQPDGESFLRRDALLRDTHWASTAAYFHYSGKWSGRVGQDKAPHDAASAMEFFKQSPARFAEHSETYGEAPAVFYSHHAPQQRVELPVRGRPSEFTDLLLRRHTTRLFDTSCALDAQSLNDILRYVYGAQAYARLSPDLVALRKTSPSGGALHPVEIYPLVLKVEGIPSGLYHYNCADHALDRVAEYAEAEARVQVERFSAGQTFFASAHVVFLYAARFRRNFWKYPDHQKAYKVLLMDMAHLSQTLYLMAADLGLGAFFTAACNESDIENSLGLDPLEQGALGMSGCGIPAPDAAVLEFPGEPYIPRETKI